MRLIRSRGGDERHPSRAALAVLGLGLAPGLSLVSGGWGRAVIGPGRRTVRDISKTGARAGR